MEGGILRDYWEIKEGVKKQLIKLIPKEDCLVLL